MLHASQAGEAGCRLKNLDTRWALTLKEADCVKTVKARLVAEGYQDPVLRDGAVGIAGYVSRSSSHLQSISLAALKKWLIWSLGIKNTFLEADGFDCELYLRAPCEWKSKDDRRAWRLRAPALGFDDAPVAFHRPLLRHIVTSAESLSSVGPLFEASSLDLCL